MPYGKIKYVDDQQLCNEILHIVDDEVVELIIIGLPLFTDGTASEMTKTVKAFAQLLHQKTDLPIILQDETLTTYEAEQRMKNSPRYNFKVDPKQIDALAASIILEDFLNNPNQGTPIE
jgi:putative Holliday junction resolvase